MKRANITKRRFDAVILAAGRGRRMGGPKAGLTLNGLPLLHWQLKALSSIAGTVLAQAAIVMEAGNSPVARLVASLGQDLPALIPVSNGHPERGPFHSIRLGLEALAQRRRSQAQLLPLPVFMVPVDCPLDPAAAGLLLDKISPATRWADGFLNDIVPNAHDPEAQGSNTQQRNTQQRNTQQPNAHWAVPIDSGRRGHPVLLTPSGVSLALALAAEQAGEFFPTLRDLLERSPGCEVGVQSSLIHVNLNFPTQATAFEERWVSWFATIGGPT